VRKSALLINQKGHIEVFSLSDMRRNGYYNDMRQYFKTLFAVHCIRHGFFNQ
jgi:hypothetical protein